MPRLPGLGRKKTVKKTHKKKMKAGNFIDKVKDVGKTAWNVAKQIKPT